MLRGRRISVIDRDVGFDSMFDWAFSLVDYARDGEIRKRVNPLPPNLKLIEGNSPLSSYVIAGMATAAGAVTYRDKGFTTDLASREHMFELLDDGPVAGFLDEREVELAKRFAFLWFFRYEVRLPLLRNLGRRFRLESFSRLGPGGDQTLSRVCEAFVSGEPFLDISRRAESVARVHAQ